MMRDRAHLRGSLVNKAAELFSLCDPEGKGYATKSDLQTLRCELPLPPEQLDIVFDALDANSDGKLTLQEFTDGFGLFLGIDTLPNNGAESDQQAENEEDEEILEELLDHLGARNLFTDEDYVREMWRRVRKEDPVMRSNFENFISKMAADLKESAIEQSSLHTTLKNRKQEHEIQVQTLYMEMEEQLRIEKEKLLDQEQRKEQKMRNELETELELKDQQLSELLSKHAEMEKQLAELDSKNSEKKYDNVKLQKDRDMLENRLSASEKMLHEMKNSLDLLRKRSLEEKRARAQAAIRVSEGIAIERENLVSELNHLKEVNKQLQDEKDELVQTTAQTVQQLIASSASPSPKRARSKHETKASPERSSAPFSNVEKDLNVGLKDLNLTEKSETETTRKRGRSDALSHPLEQDSSDDATSPYVEKQIKSLNTFGIKAYVEEVTSDTDIQNNLNIPSSKKGDSKYDRNSNAPRGKSLSTSRRRTSPRTSPPVLKKILPTMKTSIDSTSVEINAYYMLLGVDFQIKTLELEGERIALQLWDTAGQERFRSMTQQYFRKTDGIILVYDVTCETSFKNMRNWMNSIKEGTSEETIVLILGNKIDLCEKENDRVVRTKDGARISDEYGALFYETSAKTGDSIPEAIEGLACILKTKEDETIEQVLKLQEEEEKKRKKKCC
ncbi:EF-hand calcium-binding domain-containing protein 4B [Parasteatoda tepidariorum]|uniref:EF-hand calcium-binding domain-containing protein 4B n=1 Tax=Parasteatoda tepidariorum TaxID=114398 RepID=UPI0039BD1D3F